MSDRPVELLLTGGIRPDSGRYHLISGLADVWAFGYSDALTPDNYEDRGGSHWGDVLADEIAPIHGERWDPKLGDSPGDKVLFLLEGRWKPLSELMQDVELDSDVGLDAGDLCDETVSNLYCIGAWRATIDDDSPFIADMWNAFQTGGWPFGWYGDYPDGKMVVWKPEV